MKYYIFIIYCLLIFHSVFLFGQDDKLKQYKQRLKELSDKLEKLILEKKDISKEKYLNNVLSLELKKLNHLKEEYKRLQKIKKEKPKKDKPIDELPDAEIPQPKLKLIKLPKQYLELGDLYWKQHLYKEAMNAYIKGITNTKSYLAKYKLACAYEKNGHWKKAIKYYAEIAKKSQAKEIANQSAWSLNYLQWKNDIYQKLDNLPSQKKLNSILTNKSESNINKSTQKETETDKIEQKEYKSKTKSTDKMANYHLFREKRKVWILLEKLKHYQKELLIQQNKLVRNLDKLADMGKKADAYRFQQIILKIEAYNKKLEEKKKLAEESLKLNKKSKLSDAYDKLKPYDQLTQITPPIIQTVMNLNKDIKKKLDNNGHLDNSLPGINLSNKLSGSILDKKLSNSIKLNKKPGITTLNNNLSGSIFNKKLSNSIKLNNKLSSSIPNLNKTKEKHVLKSFNKTVYLRSWYPKMDQQVYKLSKIINSYFHLTDSKTAIYFSRLKNYINNSKQYLQTIHNIAEDIKQSISEGKNVRQWLQKKKESGNVTQESETLRYFLNTKDVKIDVEKEIAVIKHGIYLLTQQIDSNNIGTEILDKIISAFKDIDKKYTEAIQKLKNAILQFQMSY